MKAHDQLAVKQMASRVLCSYWEASVHTWEQTRSTWLHGPHNWLPGPYGSGTSPSELPGQVCWDGAKGCRPQKPGTAAASATATRATIYIRIAAGVLSFSILLFCTENIPTSSKLLQCILHLEFLILWVFGVCEKLYAARKLLVYSAFAQNEIKQNYLITQGTQSK